MSFKAPEHFIRFEHGWYRGIDFNSEAELLLKAIESAKTESDVQHYIKDSRKWFIPASLFEDYDFGHHEAFVIPEQRLGAEYRVDYMLVGKNSSGYHIILVEFEDVNVDYKNHGSNMESTPVRKGIVQIRDWKRWMDSNRVYFMESTGLSSIAGNIPTWGIHYCLVVSRRHRMNELSNQMRGQTEYEMPALHIVSYDRLVDNLKKLHNGF